jgi:hypothetical protein
MQLYLKICFLIFILSNTVISQAALNGDRNKQSYKKGRDTVSIGMYLNSLTDLNFTDHSFKFNAYCWCVYPKSNNYHHRFSEELEILNSADFTLSPHKIDTIKDTLIFSAKIQSKVYKWWNTSNYPFDIQTVVISLESSEYDKDKLVFKLDRDGSISNQKNIEMLLPDWKIISETYYIDSTNYRTTFGSIRNSSNQSYSSLNYKVVLTRNNPSMILFKLIIGLIVAFIISISVFFIKPTYVDPRFGLCVGGLFTTISNKYIVDSLVPTNHEFTMLDGIHTLTLLTIFIIIGISLFSLSVYDNRKTRGIQLSAKIDRWSLIIVFLSYVTLLFLLIKIGI